MRGGYVDLGTGSKPDGSLSMFDRVLLFFGGAKLTTKPAGPILKRQPGHDSQDRYEGTKSR